MSLTSPGELEVPAKTARVQIKDQPYLFTENAYGWGCVNTSSRINNIIRSYQLTVKDGEPVRCSCPDAHFKLNGNRGLGKDNECKHMAALRELLSFLPSIPTEQHTLYNPKTGWCLAYHITADEATIYEGRDGFPALESIAMSREEARKHYLESLKRGFRK